jgi:transglutaminase-like putative cysteine protease
MEDIMRRSLLISIVVVAVCNHFVADKSPAKDQTIKAPSAPSITYRNPRVYNVDYSFELVPDPNNIDRAKGLKLWIPIPREWDSQRAVKIVSVEPEAHADYTDPEHGNRMLFWDLGKEAEKPSYRADIKYRLESYEIHAEIDPNKVKAHDKTSEEYKLYTRSTHTVRITPQIREMAQEAVGDETNPYLQAKRIFDFVRKKMRYKILDYERGRGIDCLLEHPAKDERTGEEHYEGCCSQYSAFFIALCRAVGIPARSVQGINDWKPWAKEEDLKLSPPHKFETKLSPSGLSGAQNHGALGLHTWAEFYVPVYGWIPTDPQVGGFAHSHNKRVILCKGRDIKIGPEAPQRKNQGYGTHWLPLHKGRADSFHRAVWNIATIRVAKMKTLHYSDPFPADGLAEYPAKLCTETVAERRLRNWRKGVLNWPSRFARSSIPESLNLEQFYNDYPRAKEAKEAFVCHMLRGQLGDEKFFKLVDTYVDLRQKSNRAVPAAHFQELAEDICGVPLDWFFNQWIDSAELPRLKLEQVAVRKGTKDWQVRGRLLQLGDTTFRLPIELALDTENGREMQKLWIDSRATDFDFRTLNEPRKLIVDPDYKVLKIQKMAPRLWWFWDAYPELIIVYGTLGETEANKTAAEHLNRNYLGLDPELFKADIDVNEADLKSKCVILFGRPETNKISQQFRGIFPIKFDEDKFTWQGVTYDESSQGIAQIVENSYDVQGLMIMYAGLSPEATQKFCDLNLYSAYASYVIYDGSKELLRGDWEGDSDLIWEFEEYVADKKP